LKYARIEIHPAEFACIVKNGIANSHYDPVNERFAVRQSGAKHTVGGDDYADHSGS
jgi:hypothetical protein